MGAIAIAFGVAAYKIYVKGYPNNSLEAPEIPDPPKDTIPPETTTTEANNGQKEVLYQTAYDCLGQHLTLNDEISPELGCAQTISAILLKCGYKIPKKGISTVAGLTDWMLSNGFKEEIKYQRGLVITGRAPEWAHIGVTGNTHIMSNTSYTFVSKGLTQGLLQANYHRNSWYKAFPIVRMFAPS